MTPSPGTNDQQAPDETGSTDDATAAVLAAARAVGLQVSPHDLAAVTAHLALLNGFATVVGDPDAEPAPVFRP